jgi:hypothetical protein
MVVGGNGGAGSENPPATEFFSHVQNEIPDLKHVRGIYTHDLSDLARIAGLKAALDEAIEANPDLGRRWALAKDWSEQARYEVWTEQRALAIIDAIGGDEGLLEWLLGRS